MARVRMQGIVERLEHQFRRALEEAVNDTVTDADFDSRELSRAFRRAVGRKFSSWETVNDSDVSSD
jgi:phage portal protein BeeE